MFFTVRFVTQYINMHYRRQYLKYRHKFCESQWFLYLQSLPIKKYSATILIVTLFKIVNY